MEHLVPCGIVCSDMCYIVEYVFAFRSIGPYLHAFAIICKHWLLCVHNTTHIQRSKILRMTANACQCLLMYTNTFTYMLPYMHMPKHITSPFVQSTLSTFEHNTYIHIHIHVINESTDVDKYIWAKDMNKKVRIFYRIFQ